jgi:hypothetical protein
MLDIAGKNDQATHFGVAQELTVFSSQPGTGDIHHQRALQARTHICNSPYQNNPGMVLDH